MASRFAQRNSALQPQNDLFAGYNPQRRTNPSSSSSSPAPPTSESRRSLDRPSTGQLFDSYPQARPPQPVPAPYPNAPPRTGSPYTNANTYSQSNGYAPPSSSSPVRRSADHSTSSLLPRYTDSSLETLESQNGSGVAMLTDKVRQLKDLTSAINVEILDSSALAEKMNEQFEGTQLRLKGTMRRMLRMAERSGVGWRVWVGFLGFVMLVFFWVWI